MRTVRLKIFLESDDSAVARKMYNHGQKTSYRTRKGTAEFFLDAGRGDDVSFFREGPYLLALSVNTRMGYCGLQVWDLKDIDWEDYKSDPIKNAPQECENVFHQNAVEAFDGKDDWEHWRDYYLARVLFLQTECGGEYYNARYYNA